MTLKALMLAVSAAALMILGLALGLEVFCFAAAVVLLVLLFCAAGILWARRQLAVSLSADTQPIISISATEPVSSPAPGQCRMPSSSHIGMGSVSGKTVSM